MLDLLRYVDGDLGDPAIYQAMSDTLGQSVQRVLFYLEVPPPLFARIAEGISTVGRAAGNRVMVEKPFGNDLASASKLNDTMDQLFPEDAIYRVDHWLGLDPAESLMFARLANSIIEPILNRNYVQSVQITMAEAFDVADRGSLRWLQTLSIGNLAISVFRRNDASAIACHSWRSCTGLRQRTLMRIPCRGSRPPRSYAGAARIRPSVCGVRPRR